MALRSSLRFSLLAAAAVNAARVDDDSSLGFAVNEDAKKLLNSALIESDFTALTGSMGQAAVTGTAPAQAIFATAAPAGLAELSFEVSAAPEGTNAAAMKSVDDEIMARVAEKERKAFEDTEATAQAAPKAAVGQASAQPVIPAVEDSMKAVERPSEVDRILHASGPDEVPAAEGVAPMVDFGAKLDSVIDGLKMPTDSHAVMPSMTARTCGDIGAFCSDWAAKGECTKNAQYMEDKCRKSCGLCGLTGSSLSESGVLGAPSLLGVDGSMQADFPDFKSVGSQASGAFASAYHAFDSAVHRAEVATGMEKSKAEAAPQPPAGPDKAAPQTADLLAAPIADQAAVPQQAAQAAKQAAPKTEAAAAAAAAPTTQAASDNEVDQAIAKACDAEQKVLQGATPAAAAPAAAAATSKGD